MFQILKQILGSEGEVQKLQITEKCLSDDRANARSRDPDTGSPIRQPTATTTADDARPAPTPAEESQPDTHRWYAVGQIFGVPEKTTRYDFANLYTGSHVA